MSDALPEQSISASDIEPNSVAKKLVRRRQSDSTALDAKELMRRRSGTVMMAIISILLLVHRRLSYDSLLVVTLESLTAVGLLLLAYLAARRERPPAPAIAKPPTKTQPAKTSGPLATWSSSCVFAAVAMPWLVNPLAKQVGAGNGLEIVMLVSLGWGSLALAILASQLRTLSLSVVCSGFLTLFASFISDSPVALWFSLAWGIMCLWWLVNNHWAQVETAAAIGVQPARARNLLFALLGCAVFLAAAFSVADRIPVLRKLQTEVMPTSGGTRGKDSAARRGVGNGDALIAAKKHATSFGAVDTDLFLDSEKPSLFDVFSDEFGEPQRKLERVERAQALLPEDVLSSGAKSTESNRSTGSSEFSVERELPAERKPVDDLVAESLMFWQGESAAHLAVERFHYFDGSVWSNPSPNRPVPLIETTVIGEQSWFGVHREPESTEASPFVDALPEALKFTRYRTPIIPTRSGLQLWCIDEIDQSDFFAFASNECLIMPGRDHVPDYTVVRMINSRIDLERLEELAQHSPPQSIHSKSNQKYRLELNRLAQEFAGQAPRGWKQIQAVISGLRKHFQLKRETAQSPAAINVRDTQALEQFLTQRCGPDYMFATAAALMLDELGYQTRFVAGFYANPQHYIARDGEFSILPRDAHAWLEIHIGHGYWIPLEPSPGYREPRYAASWWYHIQQNRWAIAAGMTLGIIVTLSLYLLRGWLIEWASWLTFPLLRLLSHRSQVSWLTWLVEVRCRIAGVPRTKGKALREHLRPFRNCLPNELCQQLSRYLASADRMWFGGMHRLSESDRAAIAGVWLGLTTQALQRSRKQLTQPPAPNQRS